LLTVSSRQDKVIPGGNTRFFQEREKERRVLLQQQQQHIQIQPAAKLCAVNKCPVEAFGLNDWMFCKFFMVINLYFPGYLPGQELAPS